MPADHRDRKGDPRGVLLWRQVTPTLPLNPSKERWFGWWIKLTGLPLMYWHYMLKGYVWFPKHNTNFKEDAA
jgi:hypothetical protein